MFAMGKRYWNFNVAKEQEMGGLSQMFVCDHDIFYRPVENDIIPELDKSSEGSNWLVYLNIIACEYKIMNYMYSK